jgi:hypothetical protein
MGQNLRRHPVERAPAMISVRRANAFDQDAKISKAFAEHRFARVTGAALTRIKGGRLHRSQGNYSAVRS